jgi:hypothetical protein
MGDGLRNHFFLGGLWSEWRFFSPTFEKSSASYSPVVGLP